MTRRMACAAGAMLLAGLNGWTSPAHAQGPMAPRIDVAPPPARVAPPPPPAIVPPPVAPTPPPIPVAPAMAPPPPAPKAPTASAPATPTPATPAPVATSTTRLGTAPGTPGAGDKPTANEAPIVTSRSGIKKPSVMLPDVGVMARGPGGVVQARSDGGGWTRLGKLPVGNTVIEFSGADLASALRKTGTPTAPTAQQLGLLVVIAIIAIRVDGTPVVFTGSVPASAVKTLKADLRVGRDGNAMTVDFGNGPQAPQILPRTGPATLTVQASGGPYTLEPVLVSSLQANAGNSAPGMVDANSALQEVSTTR